MSNSAPQGNLLSSKDIEGHAVYAEDSHEKIGDIHRLMIDRGSGNVAYADIKFGGVFGIGKEHHMIPWRALSYHAELDGFVTAITDSQVKAAPRPGSADIFDPSWEQRLHEHYRIRGYWSGIG